MQPRQGDRHDQEDIGQILQRQPQQIAGLQIARKQQESYRHTQQLRLRPPRRKLLRRKIVILAAHFQVHRLPAQPGQEEGLLRRGACLPARPEIPEPQRGRAGNRRYQIAPRVIPQLFREDAPLKKFELEFTDENSI
jgi:hypothetical protein